MVLNSIVDTAAMYQMNHISEFHNGYGGNFSKMNHSSEFYTGYGGNFS